ncbi:hypothetical protein DID77_00725 [Candidatus Marinamargulisbacteria bacterium SCGC AG-439-L15]|nr:hypothetical protein DID77_00725 [Candidatus Marinamargulisbacteria bacterium SCGC AG-439-L15]
MMWSISKKTIASPNSESIFFNSPNSTWMELILAYLFTGNASSLVSLRGANTFFRSTVDQFIYRQLPTGLPKPLQKSNLKDQNPCLFHHLSHLILSANKTTQILKVYKDSRNDRLCILTKVFGTATFFSLPNNLDSHQSTDPPTITVIDMDENETTVQNDTATPVIISVAKLDQSIEKSYKTFTSKFCDKFHHYELVELGSYIKKIQEWLQHPKNKLKLLRLLCLNLIMTQEHQTLLQTIVAFLKTTNSDIYHNVIYAISKKAISSQNMSLFYMYLPDLKVTYALRLLPELFTDECMVTIDKRSLLVGINQLYNDRKNKKYRHKIQPFINKLNI